MFILYLSLFIIFFYFRPIRKTNERLSVITNILCNIFPNLSNYAIYYTTGKTCCINKKTIYINSTGDSYDIVIEKILHEYAHILNRDSYEHDDKFWDIFSNLLHHLYLNKQQDN